MWVHACLRVCVCVCLCLCVSVRMCVRDRITSKETHIQTDRQKGCPAIVLPVFSVQSQDNMELLSSRLTLITRFCWLWGLIVFWRKAFCVNEKMLHRVTSLSCLSRCVQSWVQPPGRQSYHTYIVFPWVRSARRSAFNINCMVCQLRNVIIASQGVRPSILITHTHIRTNTITQTCIHAHTLSDV